MIALYEELDILLLKSAAAVFASKLGVKYSADLIDGVVTLEDTDVNHDEEIRTRLYKNGFMYLFLVKPHIGDMLVAVHANGSAIQYMTDPCEKVQLVAIEECESAYGYIEKPTKEATLLYNALYQL